MALAKITKINHTITSFPAKKKVAAYARVSVDSEELLQSLSAQVSHYSARIQSNPSWEYVGVYADAGISGTGTKNRPEFQNLIADCNAGKIEIILTKSISRFARNTVDLLSTIRQLKERNISVRFERENIDSLSPDGELMVSILASYAQEESLSISENVKWGIRKRFAQGQFLAFNMYGYRWVTDHFEIVEKEAAAVHFMYRAFADGMTLTEISDALARQGVFNRKGLPFGKTSIHRILDQEKYRGFSILQRTFVADHITHEKKMNRGERPQFEVQRTHPRIISEDLHQKVEAERERRRAIGAVQWRRATCFTGKLVCGYCGNALTYTPDTSTGKGGLTKYQMGQYRCSNKRKNGVKACGAKNLPLRALRQACKSTIGPLDGASKDAEFESAWIEKQVRQIVVFADILEFHLKDGNNLKAPWKSTARSDAWTLRREKIARQLTDNKREVKA